jgi:hypothetical protein
VLASTYVPNLAGIVVLPCVRFDCANAIHHIVDQLESLVAQESLLGLEVLVDLVANELGCDN